MDQTGYFSCVLHPKVVINIIALDLISLTQPILSGAELVYIEWSRVDEHLAFFTGALYCLLDWIFVLISTPHRRPRGHT